MKNKFVIFISLFIFGLLILGYPQISLADQAPTVNSGIAGAGLTTANASGTITGAGTADTIGGCGFIWGTQSGIYTATSSKFDEGYATSSEFGWEITAGGEYNSSSTLAKGTVYYLKTYASTTVSTVYGSTEQKFLTGVDVPSSFQTQSLGDRIKLTWTAGTGAEKTMIRYNDVTTYPTLITGGEQAYWGSGTEVTLYNLPSLHIYYFSAWSSTSNTGLTTTSASYVEVKAATINTSAGGTNLSPPTTYSDSLVINAGAATTQSREVILSLKADNASLMAIADDNLFLVPLENYSTTKSWILTEGDGVKTVYVKFVSPGGVNSEFVFDAIILKTPAVEEVPIVEVPVEEVPVEEVPVAEEVPVGEIVEEEVEKPISEMTIDELKVKIAEIMTQVTNLQTQLADFKAEETAFEGCVIMSFNHNLKQGMTGDDVNCLQIILNFSIDTRVADSGIGSSGNETTYFGPLTKTAVIKFQEKYASEILAQWGLAKGTGFVGSSTRDKLNELLGK